MTDPTTAAAPRRSRLLLWSLTVVGLLAVAIVLLWNGPGSAVAATGPFEIERRADGSWPEIPLIEPGLTLSLQASKRETSTNHTASYRGSAMQRSRFASRSVGIVSLEDSSIADLMARRLIERLQQDRCIERISYAPLGVVHEPGGIAPDLHVIIGPVVFEDDTVAGNGELLAKVQVTVSDRFARGITHVTTSEELPQEVQFTLTVDATSSTAQGGIATPNARLAATAADLADAVCKDVFDKFVELREQHGEMPPLPDAFYPEYRPVDGERLPIDALFGEGNPPVMVQSWRDALQHNVTWWQGRLPGTASEEFERIERQLVAKGWRAKAMRRDELICADGPRTVRVLAAGESGRLGSPHIVGAPEPRGIDVAVQYVEHVDDEARQQVLADMLDRGDTATTVMLICEPAWSDEQRQRMLELLADREVRSPRSLLQLERIYRAADLIARADDALLRAYWYAHAGFIEQAVFDSAKKRAKKLGLAMQLDGRYSDDLLGIGFARMRPGDEPIEREVTPTTPIRLVLADADRQVVVAIGLERNQDGHWRAALRTIEQGSWGEIANITGVSSQILPGGTLKLEVLDDASDGRAKLRVTLQD